MKNIQTQRKIIFAIEWAVDKFLDLLVLRSRNIVERRFGIGRSNTIETLEAIGQSYNPNLTRERIRQIEQEALGRIRSNPIYTGGELTIKMLLSIFEAKGKLLTQTEFLNSITRDVKVQNKIIFFLMLYDEDFCFQSENDECIPHISIDGDLSRQVSSALKLLYSKLADTLLDEDELAYRFLRAMEEVGIAYQPRETVFRWLSLSKKILKNPFGEWGKDSTPGAKISGVRDYAYLILRKSAIPMHFSEIAKMVTELCDVPCHKATCHNELVKDNRFVLVGRGIYALSENGYSPGTAREIIQEILKKEGPLNEHEVISKIKERRVLKERTVLLALQDSKYFVRNKNNIYSLAVSN
jgi:hypothetical protein